MKTIRNTIEGHAKYWWATLTSKEKQYWYNKWVNKYKVKKTIPFDTLTKINIELMFVDLDINVNDLGL